MGSGKAKKAYFHFLFYPGVSFGPNEAIKSLQVFVVEAQPEESKVCVQGVKRNHKDLEQNESRRKRMIIKHRKRGCLRRAQN